MNGSCRVESLAKGWQGISPFSCRRVRSEKRTWAKHRLPHTHTHTYMYLQTRHERASEKRERGSTGRKDTKVLKGVENIFNVDLAALAGAMVPYDSRDHPADALDREDRSHGGHAHLSVFRGCERHHVPMKKKKKERKRVRPPDAEIFRDKCAVWKSVVSGNKYFWR